MRIRVYSIAQDLDSTHSTAQTEDPRDCANSPGAWPITQGVTDVRSLLAALLSWLMPSTGKRRATSPAQAVPTQHPLTDEPTITFRTGGVARPAAISTPRSPRPPEFLRGEDTPLIRPYLVAYEREQERRRQRDRRTAATLATLGIDFHGATA